jgi:biopolymer transport protein TolR
MAMATRDEGKKVNSDINVTPMVDVMLVLLIIFMVVTPMLNNKVNVDLPIVTASTIMDNANKEDAITVAVTRDGKTFVGGDQTPISELGTKVAALEEKKTNPGDDKSVYLRADTRANYGVVMDAIDGLRTGGVSQLNLLTDMTQTASE